MAESTRSKFSSFHVALARLLRTCVVCLFDWSRPSAVFRAVSATVINTIDRMAGTRPGTDIIKEGFKGVEPSLAHGNPSSTVIVVARMILVGASLNNVTPNSIFGCCCPTVRFAQRANEFALKTSAASMFSGIEIRSLRERSVSAVAFAEPDNLFSSCSESRNRNQTSEAMIGQVKCFHPQIVT